MAEGNDKPKSSAAPVHPWDLPEEEEFEDAGPRTIIARQPGPFEPPKPSPGEVLEGMMPEPDPMGGPATLPGQPPLSGQHVFDPPTFADRPSARLPRAGLLRTEPNPAPREPVHEGTQPHLAMPVAPPERKATPAAVAAPPFKRRNTGELGLVAEPVRKPTRAEGPAVVAEPPRKPTRAEAPAVADPPRKPTRAEVPAGAPAPAAPRRTTGEVRSAEAVRKATRSEIPGPEGSRRPVSRPSARVPPGAAGREALGEADEESTRKKPAEKAAAPRGVLGDGEPETTRKKLPPERTSRPGGARAGALGSDDEEAEETARKRAIRAAEPEAEPDDGPEADPEGPTAERPRVAEAGAFSRKFLKRRRDPGGGEALAADDDDVFEATKTGVKPTDPAVRKRLTALGLVGGLLAVALALYLVFQATRDRPAREGLQLAYPYGFDGARGPYGEDAPGAQEMSYEYLDEVPCGTHALCLRYQYQGENGFTGTMVVGKTPAGTWERVGDEGSPFRPPSD